MIMSICCSSSSSNALFFFRRAYSVAVENFKGRSASAAAAMMRKTAENVEGPVRKDVFWMKDPKTGDWMPESHFDQVDAVDLREKLLSNKAASKS